MFLRIIMFMLILNTTQAQDYVILLGGWTTTDGSCWSPLHDAMNNDSRFKTKVNSGDLKVIHDIPIDTINDPIPAQALLLKNILVARGLVDGDNIVLVGHSQGGLRSISFLEQFNANYNVKGIFTAGTPWGGAHIIQSEDAVTSWLSNLTLRFTEIVVSTVSFVPKFISKPLIKYAAEGAFSLLTGKIYNDFVYNAGSKLMVPDATLILAIAAEGGPGGPGGQITKFGAIVGTNTDTNDSWLNSSVMQASLKATTYSLRMAQIALTPFIWSSRKRAARAEVSELINELSKEGINHAVDKFIQDPSHDTLIQVAAQKIPANALKYVANVDGQWIDTDEATSNYELPLIHGSADDQSTKIEYNNPDAREKLMGWINTALYGGE